MAKQAEAPKFEHKGHEITILASSGEFYAKVAGASIRKPSLDAMRKYIDGVIRSKFEPFAALDHPDHSADKADKARGYVPAIVTGIKKDEYSRSGALKFIVEGRGDRRQVMVDTPENRAAAEAYTAYAAESDRIRNERQAERERLRGLIQWINASEFTVKS